MKPPTAAFTSVGVAGGPVTDVPAGASEQVGQRLAREMRHRWRSGGGDAPRAEAFLADHPELYDDAEAAVEVVYEEYCLRQATGELGVEQDIVARFPQWAGPLRVMLDCHRQLLDAERERPRFPAAGERVGDFRLLAELARGARGRVFLATEAALGDRPVVLKVTPADGGEHLSLARLQHTNIVPLYSVTHDDARHLRVMCMPYFGAATLASLLQSLAGVPLERRTGRDVLAEIGTAREAPTTGGAAMPPASPVVVDGAARQMLAHVSYVQAMSWVTACLADALQFAHERGLVHLDLKPSNVLLAADGQPMLLDFHLAREPVRPGAAPPDNFGGTPPYMPPEQRAALQALRDGRAVAEPVARRADVYALGAMLYESLGGSLPVGPRSPPLERINPRVSRGLSDVVARCLAARADDRYPDARSLGDDLRRHLTDQPLVGVGNRSPAERWRKWRRRRPGRLRATAVLALLLAGAAGLSAGALWYAADRHRQAELALHDAQRLLRGAGDVANAAGALERGLQLIEGLPFERDLRGQLREQLASARRAQLANELHAVADEVRVLYAAADVSGAQRASLAARCEALWGRRALVNAALESAVRSDAAAAASPEADLQDVALFAADVRGERSPTHAARILGEAEAMFGPNAVLAHRRQVLGGVGAAGPLSAAPAASIKPGPHTAWEHTALGRSYLAVGDLPRAAHELDAALRLDPAGRWPNFYYGLCASRLGRYEEAVAAFSVCVGTSPGVAGCYYNRGLAYAALGRDERALRDYDRALQFDPAHAAAALNRGMLHYRGGRFDRAAADLSLALDHGAEAASVHYDLALVHRAARRPGLAADHASRALQHDAAHTRARQLLDALGCESTTRSTGD